MRQIHGMLMYPCSTTEEEHEKLWQSSEFYTENHFHSEYRRHIVAMQHIAECAKIFILKNWESIENWEGLNVIILDNTGKRTEYYNYVPEKLEKKNKRFGSETFYNLMKEIDEKNKSKHNPIKTLEKVVLDPTDGDFSLTINGKDHLWIDNESVIIIADFIENELQKKI